MQLLDLPNELLHRVLVETHPGGVIRCKQTCRRIKNIIDESILLQYTIELFSAGMEDTPNHPAPIATRLQTLRDYQKAWSWLDWTSDNHFHLRLDHLHSWDLTGGVAATATFTGGFIFHTIPSTRRGICLKQWSFEIEILVEDFTIDPSQDLLIVCGQPLEATGADTMSLYVRSMLNGKAHPQAAHPVFPATRLFQTRPHSISIQICGSRVVLLAIEFSGSPLYVFDWTTGEKIMRYDHPSDVIRSISFMSERYLLIGSLLPIQGTRQCSLRVLDLNKDGWVCELHLPPFSPHGIILSSNQPIITIASEVPPSKLYTRPEAPFFTSDEDRLFVITYDDSDEQTLRSFTIFLPLSSLLFWVAEASKAGFPLTVDWETWNRSARVIKSDMPRTWVCYVQGLKAVFLDDLDNVRLYDFNQRRIRQPYVLDEEPAEDVKETYINYPSTCDSSDEAFGNSLSSYLPYRLVVKSLPTGADRYNVGCAMLSEDAVILVLREADGFRFQILSF